MSLKTLITALPLKNLEDQIRFACLCECTARKPGNVHPEAFFHDMNFDDFRVSAEVSAPLLARSSELGVGRAVRDAVIATKDAVGTNTNLGMLLLLAPLAAVPMRVPCRDGISAILNGLNEDDTRLIYEAIRLARPGGLGRTSAHDVENEPTAPILIAMSHAPHDFIARQFTHDFEDVLGDGRDWFLEAIHAGMDWEQALIRSQIQFLAKQSDSLILRKCGKEIADEAQRRASEVLAEWPLAGDAPAVLKEYDVWLRADGHRRNPGTTADLLAAMLFALVRDGAWP